MPDNIVAVAIIAGFAAVAFLVARLLSKRSDAKRRARAQEQQRANESRQVRRAKARREGR